MASVHCSICSSEPSLLLRVILEMAVQVTDRNGDAVFIKDIRKQQLFDRSCHWQGRVGKSP